MMDALMVGQRGPLQMVPGQGNIDSAPLICKGLSHTVTSPGTHPITVTNPGITGCAGCLG
jgi:hypothetical protein